MSICRHCVGWGKYNVPATHTMHGKTCAPCGGAGNEPVRASTMIIGVAVVSDDINSKKVRS